MDWTPFPKLIEEYRQQVHILNDKIKVAQKQGGFDANYRKIESLCAMRSDLLHGIYLMSKYINNTSIK